ncbi:MAG: 5-(carboxyamino)imidazole ribonucleotide synthase [Alphaproteobacteria bacterium]|nr:5-(carboxyamino)imidazole ribonucleotide synthase [Alphaproteobacteria bacterium]
MGSGQLGRMTAFAAAELGYDVHIFSGEADSPAGRVAARETVADYTDASALDGFARSVDVVTFEFENIPHESVRRLAASVPVRPGWEALRVAQDRRDEKDFLAGIGVPTAPYAKIGTRADLDAAIAKLGRPAILKTARLGYDGKGQVALAPDGSLEAAWQAFGEVPGIVEARIDFACEISVIIARGVDGATAAYVPVENRHVNHILDTTIAPAAVSRDVAHQALGIAQRIAERLEIVGLLAVEMFVTPDHQVLVNEIAPRPHNSGHWTIDACQTSQFTQFVRAVAGLPLGSPERHSDAVMKNLIGADFDGWAELAADPSARLHLYGKRESRPGRKMGHVTRLSPRRD